MVLLVATVNLLLRFGILCQLCILLLGTGVDTNWTAYLSSGMWSKLLSSSLKYAHTHAHTHTHTHTHTLAVGRVYTWGYGASGQLANNDSKGRWVLCAPHPPTLTHTHTHTHTYTRTSRPNPLEVESLLDKQVRFVACGADHMGCTVVHGWVPDEEAKECMACKKAFTTIRRRVSHMTQGMSRLNISFIQKLKVSSSRRFA